MAVQMLKRLWLGASIAFVVATLCNWSYGAMFAPLLLVVVLSRLQSWNGYVVGQLLLSVGFTGLLANLILGFLQPFPLLTLAAMALWMAISCITMTHPASYMFGFVNLSIGSVMMNVGSFAGFDLVDFSLDLFFSALLASAIAALMLLLIPTDDPQPMPGPPPQTPEQVAHGLRITWGMVMLLYLLFQCMDLADTLSAQAAAVLLLAPMSLMGSFVASRARLVGTLLGCALTLMLQLLLFSYLDHLLLYLVAFSLALGPFLLLVCQGGERGAIGFAGTSAVTVLMSGVVPGQQDLFFSSLYRMGSTLALVAGTALLLLMTHKSFPLKVNA